MILFTRSLKINIILTSLRLSLHNFHLHVLFFFWVQKNQLDSEGLYFFFSYSLFDFLTFQDFFHFQNVSEEEEEFKMWLIAILTPLKLILKPEKILRSSEKLGKKRMKLENDRHLVIEREKGKNKEKTHQPQLYLGFSTSKLNENKTVELKKLELFV